MGQGSGLRVEGSGFRDHGSGSRVRFLGFRVQDFGFRVQGSVFEVQGLPRDARWQPPLHHFRPDARCVCSDDGHRSVPCLENVFSYASILGDM